MEIFENAIVPDVFCERLARVEQIGPVRRLIFTVNDTINGSGHCVIAKLILPAEVLANIAMMLAADRSERPEFAAISLDHAN